MSGAERPSVWCGCDKQVICLAYEPICLLVLSCAYVLHSILAMARPNPQGPTTGTNTDNPELGYSANNVIANNDVSLFMRYMNDGGGIHTIGRSYNTTVSGNYFHGVRVRPWACVWKGGPRGRVLIQPATVVRSCS